MIEKLTLVVGTWQANVLGIQVVCTSKIEYGSERYEVDATLESTVAKIQGRRDMERPAVESKSESRLHRVEL